MASVQPIIARSLTEYIEILRMPAFLLELDGAPVTPWYLGQPDTSGKLLPSLYQGKANPDLEREMLREFRMQIAEFIPPKGMSNLDWHIRAHQTGMPSRILEWQANQLTALFLAVENMDASKHGRVWAFNPWAFNDAASDLAYVPMIDETYSEHHLIDLTDLEASGLPEAELPMAFRPYRNIRNYNAQNVFFTIHGNVREPLEALRFAGTNLEEYLTFILIDGSRKKAIMKELYRAGVTCATLFPSAGAIAKTVAYRYSKNYVTDV
jgi:hypothetical protein